MSIKNEVDKLLAKHDLLVHSESKRVVSHVQRRIASWIINTLILEDCQTPFRFKRKRRYKNLRGARVNLTYYPATEDVGGIAVEVMNVVRIRIT